MKILGGPVDGAWTDEHGNWWAQLDSGSNALGADVTLTVQQPDGTQVAGITILSGYTDGDITGAGGPEAYINAVVLPAINSEIKGIVAAYTTAKTPTSDMLALLATATDKSGAIPPVLSL